jgi:hypothetical protein
MNDEHILEYLRTRHRGQFEPPAGAVSSIMSAVEGVAPQRSWLASLMPAAAALAVGIVAVALFLSLSQDVGPSPDPTTSPSSAADPAPTASPTPIPSATPTPRPCCPLLQPGDTAELPATDDDGEWGSIRLERGEDLGGYPDAAIPGDTFVIEVFVVYDPQRVPDPAQFGRPDWAVRPADAPADRFFVIEAQEFERANGIGLRPAMPLGVWPGAADIFTTPTEGRIDFAVPRRDAELQLELVYRLGDDEQVFALRDPGPAPEPVAVATPQPTSATAISEAVAMADALFTEPDGCANPEDGYRLTFPDAWYTNTATGDVPACSWFTPEFFEVTAPGEPPDEIWIEIAVIDGLTGYTGLTEIYDNEELTIDGLQAFRVEYNHSPAGDPDFRGYHFVIPLGENGPTLVAGTSTDRADNYLLAKFVLNRIMASFRFTP